MKKNIIITLLAAASLTSCGEYNKLLKSTDYEYKYEAAKNYFAKGQPGPGPKPCSPPETPLLLQKQARSLDYLAGLVPTARGDHRPRRGKV